MTANEATIMMIGFVFGVVALRALGFVPHWRAYQQGKEDERHRLYLKFDLPQYACPHCWTEYHKIGDHDIAKCGQIVHPYDTDKTE